MPVSNLVRAKAGRPWSGGLPGWRPACAAAAAHSAASLFQGYRRLSADRNHMTVDALHCMKRNNNKLHAQSAGHPWGSELAVSSGSTATVAATSGSSTVRVCGLCNAAAGATRWQRRGNVAMRLCSGQRHARQNQMVSASCHGGCSLVCVSGGQRGMIHASWAQ